jgi:hypothetical protein
MEHPGVHSEFINRWLTRTRLINIIVYTLCNTWYLVAWEECALKCGVIDLECGMETQRHYRLLAEQDGRPTKFAQTVERPTKTG